MSVLSLDADENPSLLQSSNGPAQTIILISKEGHRMPVARQALMASELCKTTLEGDRDATEIPLYHIEGAIVAKVIDYLTYHMKVPPRKIEKPLQSSSMLDLVDKWDANFIENGEGPSSAAAAATAAAAASAASAAASSSSVPSSPASSGQTAVAASSLAAAAASAPSASAQEVLFKLLLAANYLNIRPLLALACARMATLLRGRTPDQIRAVFNIRNDFTQAEEEEVRKEYKNLIDG